MKALMGSYLEVLPHRYGARFTWFPREAARSRQDNRFIGCRKRFSGSFHSIFVLSSENQTLVESEEFQTKNIDRVKTTRVRFKLNKECEFGQHFLVVGDDPNLGSWDPSEGVPFNWSDGHVWTAELDVPCGKVIRYKFILKEDDERILWQPGPDRILETWNTEKTITIFEDWNDPEFQNIVEDEEFIDDDSDLKEESFLDSMLVENLTQPVKDAGNQTDMSTGIIEEEGEEDSNTTESEVLVLVPGMAPVQGSEEEEETWNELKEETAASSSHSTDTDLMVKKKHEFDDKERQDFFKDQEGIFKLDMQWGQKTLQKVLSVFRF